MKNLITFDKFDTAYEYGRQDARQSVFDTFYLERSADYSLSYLAGWQSVPLNERKNKGSTFII